MQRSAQRRSPTTGRRNRRVIALTAAVLVFGGMFAVSQVSDAATRRLGWGSKQKAAPCASTNAATKKYNTRSDLKTSTNGEVENHAGDGQAANANQLEREARQRGRKNQGNCTPTTATASPSGSTDAGGGNNGGNNGGDNGGNQGGAGSVPPGGADGNNNGLQVLGRDCTVSKLNLHTGFQDGNVCANTQMGEVPTAANGSSLLITEAPQEVNVNQAFTLTISTRNLVRDRFLGAAAGGYYIESSFLNNEGIVRGHFHTACRVLENTNEAPNAEPVPAFFVATEDGQGGRTPDSVQINVPGIAQAGTVQCASWAGDGSHRVPMEQRANIIPAFDSVRIQVR